jgi:signal transduction histidine kinase
LDSSSRTPQKSRAGGWLAQAPPGEPYVGRFFTLLFWGYFVATYASYLFGERRYGVVPVTLAFVALAFAWLALPWEPRVPRTRLFGAPAAFAAVSFLVVHLTGFGLAAGLYSVAVANAAFVFGLRWAVVYAVTLVPLVFANHLWSRPDLGALRALELTSYLIPTFAFVLGMCAMTLEAVRRQEKTRMLFEELEEVHSELKRYSEQVKELAISEERNRMAREIHDSLGHYLARITVQLEVAAKLGRHDPDRAREAVVNARASASEALSEVRRAVRALKPLSVEEKRGTGALEALARGFEGTGVVVSFRVEGEERGLSPEADLLLYRALQEGLTNALKHSGASRVEARLSFGPSRVKLRVKDNGRGMSHEHGAFETGGFGLSGLEERVVELGGAFEVGEGEKGGFVLEVELPVRLA